MKAQASLLLLVSAVSVAAALGGAISGCSSEHSDDFGPPSSQAPTSPLPSPTLPSMATFVAKVEPFYSANTCGRGGCHAGPSGVGDTKPFIVTLTTAQDFAQSTCNPHMKTFGASPTGSILDKYCSGSGTPNGGHSGITATAQNCTDLYTWLAEGTGAAAACP